MKTTIKILSVIVLVAMGTGTFAQSIDESRMDRDLQIAENILRTLTNNGNTLFSYSRSLESTYVPEYGVIFSLPQQALIYHSSSGGISISTPVAPIAPDAPDGGTFNSSFNYVIVTDDDEEESDEDDVVSYSKSVEQSRLNLKEQITEFLIDYAKLIGQLKPSDRIMVNVRTDKNQVWFGDDEVSAKRSGGLTAEIQKGDLGDYERGKLTREQAIAKIKFTEKWREDNARDLELFASIFATLYRQNFSTTYYTSARSLNYERLENLGVIYNMKVYSSTSNKGLHTIHTTGESGLTREERDRKVNEMYTDFEKSIRKNMIEYGRTISSLKPAEMLFLKIKLTQCKKCEMPEEIELSVKGSVLSDYNSGKTSLEKAMAAVSLKETRN